MNDVPLFFLTKKVVKKSSLSLSKDRLLAFRSSKHFVSQRGNVRLRLNSPVVLQRNVRLRRSSVFGDKGQ